MRKYPFVSLVVPTKNEEKNLPRLLESVAKIDYPKNKLEIIIVDGYSTDETVAIAKRYNARIFYNPKFIRGAGCQIGLEKAKGEFIASTDADCVVPRNWLKGLLKHFVDEKIAAVGGPNVTPKDDTLFAKAAGETIWLLTRAGARYGFSSQKTVEIYHNPGCNVLYRKKAMKEAGGYNTNLLTCEDEELDYRLRKIGYKLLFTSEVAVDHYRRSTYRKIFIQSYRFAIGRMQAIKMFNNMARWFHFGPSLLLLSVLVALTVALLFPQVRILALLYLLTVFLLFLSASWYLALTKRIVPFHVYLLVFFGWFLGWGAGFLQGILKKCGEVTTDSSRDVKIKDTWSSYWKNYHGVTKIGAWSQKESLKKVFLVVEKESIKKNIKMIDIGCGEGRTLQAFREKGFKNSIGIDNIKESLEICQKNGLKINRDIFLVDASSTKYRDKEFGLVFSEGLLEHFQNPNPIMKEMARISKRYVLLIQPNHYSLYGMLIAIFGYIIRGNVREYSFDKNYFVRGFGNFGFRLKFEEYTPLYEFFILLFEKKPR